jgi:hypothetical protein
MQSLHRIVLVGTLAVGIGGAITGFGTGCTANVHDNTLTVDHPTVTFDTSVDVQSITAGEDVPMTLHAANVFLCDPKTTPPPAHTTDAGHFQIYLDETGGDPILITAETQVNVKIPVATPPGPHKLICRVHHHDGTPTEGSFEMNITVKASVTVGTPTTDAGK